MTDPLGAVPGNDPGSTRSMSPADGRAANPSGGGADSSVVASEACPDAGPPTAPPGYDLLDEIGRGGMGVVYRARELAMNRHVAIKILHDHGDRLDPARHQLHGLRGEPRYPGRLSRRHPHAPTREVRGGSGHAPGL